MALPDYLDPHRAQGQTAPGPSEYRRTIRLPTLVTSFSFLAERKALKNPALAGRWRLEIRMQLMENIVGTETGGLG
jgi:hypothetical protein